MKVFIIGALTADGFIAKDEKHAAMWTSKADKKFFKERTKQAGVIVMGSHTYETIGRALPDRRTIVLSRNKTYGGVETTTESPEELVSRLEKEGVQELGVCGGTKTYTAFMKAGLVDTLYISVEPIVFGSGMGIFKEPLETKLELISNQHLGDGTVLLEYHVIR